MKNNFSPGRSLPPKYGRLEQNNPAAAAQGSQGNYPAAPAQGSQGNYYSSIKQTKNMKF